MVILYAGLVVLLLVILYWWWNKESVTAGYPRLVCPEDSVFVPVIGECVAVKQPMLVRQ